MFVRILHKIGIKIIYYTHDYYIEKGANTIVARSFGKSGRPGESGTEKANGEGFRVGYV